MLFKPFPKKPWFLHVCSTSLLKNTEGRAISPFHTWFSTSLENFMPFLSNLKLFCVKSFSLEESTIYRLGKIFSSAKHEVLRVSYCDHSPSVVRPSVHLSVVHSHFIVYTLASTNINQSAPNLVQLYMIIRS